MVIYVVKTQKDSKKVAVFLEMIWVSLIFFTV